MSIQAARELPAVNAILDTDECAALLSRFRREFVVRAVREAVADARSALLSGGTVDTSADGLAAVAAARLSALARGGPRRAINATGVVLHTGLGRAPLPAEWIEAGYCDLEVSLATGERGDRQDHVRAVLRWLTGAEDALVVNNNAAATLLAVDTLARGREVIVARGQLVEIGGSFRLPDVVAASGARLVEVGTTNRVRPDDYRAALTPDTALILQVHPSNFRVTGFTESVGTSDLAAIAHEAGVPLAYDVGSGCLFDTTGIPGLEREPAEPRVDCAVSEGADLVCFSGDKLLGGPQAGVVAGKADLVRGLARNPLARALRIDKLCLAGLSRCLAAHLLAPTERPPAVQLLLRPDEAVRADAERLVALVRERAPELGVSVEPGEAAPGSGSLPGTSARSWRVAIRVARPEQVARELRHQDPAVFGLVRESAVMLDMRAVSPDEVEELCVALGKLSRR